MAIAQNGVRDKRCTLGACPNLKVKACVLIRGARRGKEPNLIVVEELAPIDGRPNGRFAVEDARAIDGAIRGARHILADDPKQLTALAGRGPIQIKVALYHIGMLSIGLGDQLLERILKHKVVGLKNAHVLTARHLQTAVHRVAVAAVGFVDHLYTGVALHVLADDIRRAIGGTVIDTDDLDVLERLRHGGIEALAQIALDIANGDKQRNFRGIRVLQENLLLNSV